MATQKSVFFYALLFTLAVFGIGILVGFAFENIRNNNSYQISLQSEISMTDIKLQTDILNNFNIKDCNSAVNENIRFGNNIYDEARLLENYEKSNKISNVIKFEHKKFDLLRTLFWMNSMQIKEKCNSPYINVVYFYNYNNPSLSIRAQQDVYSSLLMQLKQKYGDSIILIPISGDNNLVSISTLMNNYNITQLPTIMIDEDIKITNITPIEYMEGVISKKIGIQDITYLNKKQ